MKDLSKKFKAKNKKILNKNNVKLWAKKELFRNPNKVFMVQKKIKTKYKILIEEVLLVKVKLI